MLRNYRQIREVKELRNEEAVNQLLASDSENWILLDVFHNDENAWYVLARMEELG